MNKDRWQGALSRPPRLSGGGIYLMQSGAHECYITIEFDAGIYSKQAVQSAIYDLDIAALISITGHNKKIIQIKIQSPEDNNTTLKAKIYKAVLDHQIRIDVQKEFGPVRKLILAQAFFPFENLDQILGEMEL